MIFLLPFASVTKIEADKYLTLIATERNSDANKKYLRTAFPTNPDNQIIWFNKIIADRSCSYFFLGDSSRCADFCGYCGLDKIDYINRTAEISIMIFTKFQEKGFGKEAVKKLIEYGFLELGLNCLFAESYLYPERELFIGKFWKGVGLTLEGVLRKRKFWQGNYYDSGMFSIIKGE